MAKATQQTDDDILLATPVGFAMEVLGMDLYPWQANVLTQLEVCPWERVKITVATPNGAGKTERIVASAFLWWLSIFPQGKVVITSASGLQIDTQIYPAIKKHESKFPSWKFIDREVTTPTGGLGVLFTTDEEKRAEGHHPVGSVETGPVLIIIDEAKSVQEGMFMAFDRCRWTAILYVSSPGSMHGRFYESHTNPALKFKTFKAGLAQCPHISQEIIDDIIVTYKSNPQFIESTLHGNFMLAAGETKFDQEGLDHLAAMSKEGHDKAKIGRLELTPDKRSVVFIPDKEGWLWMDQEPTPGTRVLISCDPNTFEQAEGTTDRDNTACPCIRDAYLSEDGTERKTHVSAVIHWPGGVKFDSDVMAERIALFSQFYGWSMVVIESNNSGSALIKTLQLSHPRVPLWRRTKPDDINPNKQLKIVGYLTGKSTREAWVEAVKIVVRDKSLICRYKPATDEFQTFITLASGRSEAIAGKHDDWVAAIGIGLVVKCWTTIPKFIYQPTNYGYGNAGFGRHSPVMSPKGDGACG